MYIILKTGLTACGKVWKEGERINDASAKEMGFDKWFESLEPDARQRSFVSTTDAKLEETPKEVTNEKPVADIQPMLDVIEKAGLTLEKALTLKWVEKTKTFGIKMAKVINDYGKSISA